MSLFSKAMENKNDSTPNKKKLAASTKPTDAFDSTNPLPEMHAQILHACEMTWAQGYSLQTCL